MLNSIYAQNGQSFGTVLPVLCLGVVLGLISSVLYIKQNRYASRSFAVTLIVLPLITNTVILVVNGNLGAGIAVAGSFSLIRFRSAQGSGKEILAIFLSASLGLCLGAGYVTIACLLLLIYILTMLLLQWARFGAGLESVRELIISIPESLDYEGLFDDLLKEYCTASELETVRTAEMGTVYQLIYRVTPGSGMNCKTFLDAVRERNGNLPVSLGRIPETGSSM